MLLAVTVRYGCTLDARMDVLSPAVMRALFSYAAAVPAEIAAAVAAWLAANPPAPGTSGFVTLEVMVFPDILADRQQPILDVLRLDYALTG